jgi:hypothetical protein
MAKTGFAANATLNLIHEQQWRYVFFIPETRKVSHIKYL